jgi:integrase
MRKGKQYRLRWQDVDLKLGIITVPRSKPGEKRHIPINSIASAALEILRDSPNSSERVCTPLTWQHGEDARRWFEECLKQAGIVNFRWHDLRHTFASRLVMAGVDLRTVQELLGHKTIAMTIRYSHLAPQHQRAAIECLANRKVVAIPALEERKSA